MPPRNPDHPRACGANRWPPTRARSRNGSSPRVRGKLLELDKGQRHVRIIPARAGQTAWRIFRFSACPDHPRACGANALTLAMLVLQSGSSPRVRGKRKHDGMPVALRRIIPARAGQTVFRGQAYRQLPDHPRACGANPQLLCCVVCCCGSSPRVRGKPPSMPVAVPRTRIIPARAGQTAWRFRWCRSFADHPRACGANHFFPFCIFFRIIPARAGQTALSSGLTSDSPDHPRACGANVMARSWPMSTSGSSPRVRGKLIVFFGHDWSVRIIPARAGQTRAPS